MSLLDKANALERKLKPKSKVDGVIININPCYDCEGCENCSTYHKGITKPHDGPVILVEGEDEEIASYYDGVPYQGD